MQQLYKLILLCLLMPNLVLAQGNLVPNSSFEDTVHCPVGTDQMVAVTHWFSARATPDYFHPCANATSPIVGVPDNFSGYQTALVGQAYAGILSYNRLNQGYREHIQIQLLQSLQQGTEYFISAYFSRGDSTSSGERFDCATNKLGFQFSNIKYDASVFDYSPINNLAHVYTDDIIYDSLNWVKVSGSFIADSNYTYLLIGNFFEENNILINQCTGSAYYYIDNVCVSTNAGTCDVTVSATQSLQAPTSNVQLYPNPATDQLMLTNLVEQNEFVIFNSSGFSKAHGIVSHNKNSIDISSLPSGLYFLKLNNQKTYKFLIAH